MLFLALNFSVSLLRTNTSSAVHHPGIKPYCILSISSTSCKRASKIFSCSLKACSNNFIQFYGLRGFPFPLKLGTNKLNIYSSGNLSLKKILNMFVKDFKHLSLPAINISRATPEGPLHS